MLVPFLELPSADGVPVHENTFVGAAGVEKIRIVDVIANNFTADNPSELSVLKLTEVAGRGSNVETEQHSGESDSAPIESRKNMARCISLCVSVSSMHFTPWSWYLANYASPRVRPGTSDRTHRKAPCRQRAGRDHPYTFAKSPAKLQGDLRLVAPDRALLYRRRVQSPLDDARLQSGARTLRSWCRRCRFRRD